MYETVGKRIKTYKNLPFHWFLDKFYTVLYIFLQVNTFSYILHKVVLKKLRFEKSEKNFNLKYL